MSDYIDQSVYPDLDDPPASLETIEQKADYLQRVCAAWDFGIHPEPQTFELLSGWREVFDRFPLPTSIGYRAFRAWFGWEPLAYPAHLAPPEPRWRQLDRLEGREPDPCEEMI